MLDSRFHDASAMLGSGVYLLLRKGVVVYVGQSRSMLKRVGSHDTPSGRKRAFGRGTAVPFDEVFICPCPVDELDSLEQQMIAKHTPRHNVKHNPRTRVPRPLAEITASILAHRHVSAAPCASSRPSIDRRGR